MRASRGIIGIKQIKAYAALISILLIQTTLSANANENIVGARMPALSPDGKTLAFVYKGDIWSVPSTGGRAIPLTQHVAMDSNPIWSPDGTQIAFSSKRNGNFDIFIIPATGGSPKQITWNSQNEIPSGWSPDGKEILFSARRDGKGPGIFSVNVGNLANKKYAEDFTNLSNPSFSPDGKTIVYARFGFPWTRPRYTGSGAMQINLLDVDTGICSKLVDDNKQHIWSQFMPSGEQILTVTIAEPTPGTPSLDEIGKNHTKIEDSSARTPNLWLFDLQGNGRQITSFVGDAVRSPSVASQTGDIAFEYDIDLYILRSGEETPQKIAIQAPFDDKYNKRVREQYNNNGATELAVTDDASTVFFGLRSEIWSIAVNKPSGVANRQAILAKRLTDWVGEDSNFIISAEKNPTKLYFTSDREKNIRLYELDLESEEITCLWDREEDILSPKLSPDGKAIAFWASGADGGLFRINLEDKTLLKLINLPASFLYNNGGGDFSWSPDGKWIAYVSFDTWGTSSGNIFIIGSGGGTPVNATQLNAQHRLPTWSQDGKYLYFSSNRDGNGIYRLPLLESLSDSDDVDISYTASTNKVNVIIDFEKMDRRIVKHSNINPSEMLPALNGELVVIAEGDIHLISYDGKNIRRISSGGNKHNLQVAYGGKKCFYIYGNGGIYGQLLQNNNQTQIVTFQADFERNINDERRAAFAQFWRNFKRGFYDENMHGRDWDKIRERYERLLPSIETGEEFGVLMNRMTGELESSHSEINTPSGYQAPFNVKTPQLGFIIDYTWSGPGIRVAEVPKNMPGDYKATRIEAGEYIMQINGKDVKADENLFKIINNSPQDLTFMVSERPSTNDVRIVKYSAPTDSWNNILYENKIEERSDKVAIASNNRLAYIHISAMGAENQIRFEREVYDRIRGKEGLIIDVRGNRGGNISDTLISWLMRRPHGYVKPRDQEIQPVPQRSWAKPIIVLSDQEAYSNGEIFTTTIRANKLGLVVGMPTPGYVIWTYSMPLVDGTSARMPLSGAWRLDGTPTENMGEEPDIGIELTAEDYRLGRDPQLDKAIEELLKQIDSQSIKK